MKKVESLNTEEKEFLIFFIEKTGMFVTQLDRNNLVSFLTGYEIGKQNKNRITENISDLIANKYKIEYRNTGWPGQITELSNKFSLSWVETFKVIVQEILKK